MTGRQTRQRVRLRQTDGNVWDGEAKVGCEYGKVQSQQQNNVTKFELWKIIH